MFDAPSDFLIAREQKADRTVADFGMFHQMGRRLDDRGDARLVVAAKQRGAVGRDQRRTVQLIQSRIVRDADDLLRIARQERSPPA